jgi:DNA-binding beta-propeller fold protein YncE
MRSHRRLASLLVLTLLGAVACGGEAPEPSPRRPLPTGPEVYVAVRDGALVRFELKGTAAGPVTELLPDKESQWYAPVQGGAGRVTVTRYTEGASESITHSVGVVDATTGRVVSGLGPDGPVAGLLLSRDGRYRYELISPDSGVVTHIDRVATDGGARTALIPESHPTDRIVAGVALSPDDATLYVVLAPDEGPTRLVAIDTGSGRTRTLSPDIGEDEVHGVEVSPDGRTLALTVEDPDDGPDSPSDSRKSRVVLVPVGGGEPRWIDRPDASATAFTRSGAVLLVLGSLLKPALALADPATGAVSPIVGARGVVQAVSVD